MAAVVTPEVYTDQIDTTVASGGYTAASGTLNVASTASPFSQTNQFHVSIIDQTNLNNVKAVLKVTAVNSATQWAVTADSGVDNNALENDLVVLCLSEGAMDQVRADEI